MGRDYTFAIGFGLSGSPASQFADIAVRLFTDPVLRAVKQFNIYDFNLVVQNQGSLHKAVVAQHNLSQENIDFSSLISPQFIAAYSQEHYQFECIWDIPRYFETENGIDHEIPNICLRVWGKEFYPGYRHPTHVAFEASVYNYYYIPGSPAQEKNLELLLGEIEAIANAGAITIYGNDGDDFKPMEIQLRYHRYFSGFLQDINLEVSDETRAENLVMNSLKTLENIRFRHPNYGLILYNKFGTAGTLKAFYEELIKQHSSPQ